MSNSIKIGPRFFQVEKKNYSNWKWALIRELLQNAVDSRGCSQISFEIKENENSDTLICRDNGAGMSREILETKFLVMGETTKGGADDVGGFGKARVLICWAQASYKIISDNYICAGSGAEYSITDSPHNRGCVFEIETEKTDWAHIIQEILSNCNLWQSIYINGDKYTAGNEHRGKLIRELSFGQMFANKSAGDERLIVRVNGVWMFSKYISAKARVCVEISPEKSREVLTANRDGLQWAEEKELDKFLNELASDTRSALKDKTKRFIKFFGKSKCFVAKQKRALDAAIAGAGKVVETVTKTIVGGFGGGAGGAMSGGGISLGFGETTGGIATMPDEAAAFTSYPDAIETPKNIFMPVKKTSPIFDSMIIVNESNDPEIVKVIRLYDPENWTKEGTRAKLLKIWACAVEKVLEEYVEWRGGEFGYAFGWIFDDSTEGTTLAQHRTEDSVHYFLLNPLDKENKMRYSINNKADLYSILVKAVHEVCHVEQSGHDEDFSSLMTALMERVLAKESEIFRAIKEVK